MSFTGDTCWYVTGLIGKLSVNLLVDTGSATSLLSVETFKKIKGADSILRPTDARLSTASGKPMDVSGEADIHLRIGGIVYPRTVVIADLGEMEGILGLDFLEDNQALIDVAAGYIQTAEGQVILHRGDLGDRVSLCIAKDVVVPPTCEYCVSGFIGNKNNRSHKRGSAWIMEPSDKFQEENRLILARSLIDAGRQEIPLMVLNTASQEVRLRKGMVVGDIQPVVHVSDNISAKASAGKVHICSTGLGLDGGFGDPKSRSIVVPNHLEDMVTEASADLDMDQRSKLERLVCSYANVFAVPDGQLGCTDRIRHTIDTGDARPIRQVPRWLAASQREIAEKEINKMLDQGTIEPSDSPWAAPIVLVAKKDGTTRFCVDYRKLNNVTRKDAFPLPRIDETLDTLSGTQWFSTLDMASGYYQIGMDDRDKCKTAFTTHMGLYQFRVMPFGLCGAPATFERVMELVLRGLRWERCLVYLDDVIVFGKTFEQALENLEEVFSRFQSANLKLKPKKCHLFRKEVNFLGHIVSGDGIRCDPSKISAVKDWETPTSVAEVRSFLGLASYYRKFVEGFATIASPLHDLLRKNTKFVWTDTCQEAFSTLKERLTRAPVLAYPEGEGIFVLDTDASGYGIGAVLSQVQEGQEKVIAYASKALNKSQRRYCTTYRELLAAVVFIKHFRSYLGMQTFILRTDHSSLQWLLNFRDAENMLARWLTVLTAYSFEIVHRKGTKHGNADALSRKPRHCKCDSCPDCKSTELVCAAGRTGKGRKKPCNTRGAEVSLSEGGSENIEGPRAEQCEN